MGDVKSLTLYIDGTFNQYDIIELWYIVYFEGSIMG